MKQKNKTKKGLAQLNLRRNKRRSNLKGFTLLEALIAVLIFSLAMVMISGVFANLLKNYTKAKKTQKNIENAQYAMNLMAKTIRTSEIKSVASGSMTDFYVLDYSQNKCIQYKYDSLNKKIQVGTTTDPSPADLTSDCNWGTIASFSDLATNIIDAKIDATPTTGSTLGKVSISLEVQDDSQQTSKIPIQMSVSLRQ